MTREQADAAVAEARRTVRAALLKVTAAGAASGLTPLSWLLGDSQGRAQALANLRRLDEQVDRWATTRRAWAEAGRRQDGNRYEWAEWFGYGREVTRAAADHAAVAWDATPFAVAAGGAWDAAQDVARPFQAAATAWKALGGGWVWTRRAKGLVVLAGAVVVGGGALLAARGGGGRR